MYTAPAFQFYAADYLASSKVQRMTLEEEGAYIRLLCYNWQDGSIPADISALARLCKTTPKKMAGIWQALQECFGTMPDLPQDRLVNPRLEHIRSLQIAHRQKQSEAGKRGAAKTWGRHGKAIDSPMAKNGSSSPSPISNRRESKKQILFLAEFEEKWGRYPVKDGKKEALRHWTSTVTTHEALAEFDVALDKYLQHLQDTGYTPKNGSTFFNNWRDWVNWQEPPRPDINRRNNAIAPFTRPLLDEAKEAADFKRFMGEA